MRGKQFASYGRKTPIEQLSGSQVLTYDNFADGFDLRDQRHDLARGASPRTLDVIAGHDDWLRRVHGVSVEEWWPADTFPGLDITQVAVHANLDYAAELLLFAPPLLGVKRDSATTWYDFGLTSGRRYGYANFGGTFVFSNRYNGLVYARQSGATELETLEEASAGLTYASFAARLFAGNVTIDGNVERMGIAWSAANSDYRDWTGLGSGFELLIDDMSVGDKIMALKPMGLDQMAVLCRNSLWVGTRTGLVDRPADFRPRVAGLGTVNGDTAVSTREGAIFLSDSGVYLFNGNETQALSEQINPELLPLDYDRLDFYKGVYNPKTQRYYLMTPRRTYLLDMKRGRWFRMSLEAIGGVMWAEQFAQETWDESEGIWDTDLLLWDEGEQSDESALWFVGEHADGGLALGQEFEDMRCYFDKPQRPYYQLPSVQTKAMDRLIELRRTLLQYRGSGKIGLRAVNHEGDYVGIGVYALPSAIEPRLAELPMQHVGIEAGLQIDWASDDGCVEISKVELSVKERSQRTILTPIERLEYDGYDEMSILPETLPEEAS